MEAIDSTNTLYMFRLLRATWLGGGWRWNGMEEQIKVHGPQLRCTSAVLML